MPDSPYSAFPGYVPGLNYQGVFNAPSTAIDWTKLSKLPAFNIPGTGLEQPSPTPATPDIVGQTGQNAVQAAQNAAQAEVAYLGGVKGFLSDWRDQMMNDNLKYQQASLMQVYPYLDQMQTNMIGKNLAASEQFYKLKQQSPTNVQAIMESKQGQIASAADAEYKRSMGIAAQTQAAKDFAKSYSGTMLSMA